MQEHTLAIIMLAVAAVVGIFFLLQDEKRSARDILADLTADGLAEGGGPPCTSRVVMTDSYGKAGLLTEDERRRFRRVGRVYPCAGVAAGIFFKVIFLRGGFSQLSALVLCGLSFGVMVQQGRLRRLRERYIRSLEFYLPIVMERLVMAAQSGLDILAAIGAITGPGEEKEGMPGSRLDPVTRLLAIIRKLTDRGLNFDAALQEVALAADCSSLRHAFVHLAVAYQEGGELVMPLKELSDATQAYYQESIDEEIAKLPVKATLPLLCTFSGLILCFITPPVVQLMHLAGNTARGLQ